MMLQNLSVFKLLGIFGTIIMLSLFFGGAIIGIVSGIKDKNYNEMLKSSGGKLISLDSNLKDLTGELLIESQEISKDNFKIIFGLSYGLSILFMYFIMFYLLFKFGNWALGIKAFSAFVDILLMILIFCIFFALQYLYGIFVLDKTVYPFQGVWTFISTAPKIINNLII